MKIERKEWDFKVTPKNVDAVWYREFGKEVPTQRVREIMADIAKQFGDDPATLAEGSAVSGAEQAGWRQVWINPHANKTALVRSFKKYLTANPPQSSDRRGKDPVRRMMAELKALKATRLMHACGSIAKARKIGGDIYQADAEWYSARARVEDVINDLIYDFCTAAERARLGV